MPKDRTRGPCRHGKIGSFYFFANGSQDDPAFGFFDIELSVQRLASGTVRVELYAIADGYQSSRGIGTGHPIKIALMSDNKIVASTEWVFPDVICGHADPMNFASDLELEASAFQSLDRIDLLAVEGFASPCE